MVNLNPEVEKYDAFDPHKIEGIPDDEASVICQCEIFSGYHTHPAPVKPPGKPRPSRDAHGNVDLVWRAYHANVFMSLWFSFDDWRFGNQVGLKWFFMADHLGNIKSIDTENTPVADPIYQSVIHKNSTSTVGSWK